MFTKCSFLLLKCFFFFAKWVLFLLKICFFFLGRVLFLSAFFLPKSTTIPAIRTQNNPLSQNSIPAPEATVPDTPEEKIPKSLNGEGVKNTRKQATTSISNTQDSRLCFRCKQLGHLTKDCPELPYCSKCRTQGHIPAKCPTKQQDNRRQDERHQSADERCKTQREDLKKAQDRPQFSNTTNKCLNCVGDH